MDFYMLYIHLKTHSVKNKIYSKIYEFSSYNNYCYNISSNAK